jgi:hypothetical protein
MVPVGNRHYACDLELVDGEVGGDWPPQRLVLGPELCSGYAVLLGYREHNLLIQITFMLD